MGKANEAMEKLTAQWYNAMVTGLGLSKDSFQLYQGPNSLMNTSQDMWNMFNAVPPKSINSNYLNPDQANNFSSNYNLILSALVTNPDNDFQNCLGDYYSSWQAYFKDNDPVTWDSKGISGLFKKWAMKNAPSKTSCVTALTKELINPVNIAYDMFNSAEGSYAWNKSIDALYTALAGGAKKSFTMDSNTESSNVSHTWAKGSASVFFDIFSFGGGASYDKLSKSAISEGLNISASYEKVTTFAAGPMTQNDPNNPILAKYMAWYMGAVLGRAYQTKDNTVWNNQKPTTWETVFGVDGFLQRMTSALVVADGIEIAITSSATYNSSERTEIKAAAKIGMWPFFSASGSGGSTTEVTFDDKGKFTSTTKIARGNPQILGILQSPMSKIFG